jgi:DNA-binding CsgD family transcriptional regulator/tetratricopeptide (TPR) repeat protein
MHRALSPSMFGREAQLGELERALEQVRAGTGRLVFVAGEAGIGKTRLVQEFVARAPAGTLVAQGQCFDEDPAEPFAPFRELLRGMLPSRRPEDLLRAAGPWAAELGWLLPVFEEQEKGRKREEESRGSSSVSSSPLLPFSPSVVGEKRRLFEAIFRVLRPVDEQCRIVVLEDLHWSDQTSQELIAFLARAIAHERVLLIGTYRADELNRRHPFAHLIAGLMRERLYHEVRLVPLTLAEMSQLLEATLGRPLPPAFAAALYERTEGNPFFAEEVLGALLDNGRLDTVLQAARERRRLDLAEIPLSVRDSIQHRTAGLDQATLQTLRHAAVIGRRFDFDLLATLTRLPEPDLLRSLAALVERQLVLEDADCPEEDRYRFRHELLREAVLESMLRRERRTMHREVLRALEERHGEQLGAAVDQLAYHSLQAREMPQAARYARLAGDRAVALAAYREALAHYDAALEASDENEVRVRAELLERLGHAAYPLGDVRRSLEAWREAHTLYDALGARRKAADVLRWLGRASWELGDEATAFAHTEAALAALEGEPPCHELAMVYSALSHLYMLHEQSDASIGWGEKALALAEQLGDTAVRAHALNNIGVSLCELGRYEEGTAALEQSLALAREAGLHLDAVRAFINLGGQLTHLGEFRRALALHREAVAYAERVGFDLRIAVMLPKLAWIEFMVGEWHQAEARIAQTLRAADLGAPIERSYVQMIQADLMLRQGRTSAAAELIAELRPRLPGPNDCWDALNTAHLQSLVYADGGDLRRAAGAVDEALRVWNIGGRPRRAIWQLVDALDILLRAGRAGDARVLLATAEGLLAAAAPTQVELAKLAEARGLVFTSAPEALGQLRTAADTWQRIGLPFEEGCARRRLAEALLQRGTPAAREQARQELQLARTLLEALGAAPELSRLEAVERHVAPPRRTTVRESSLHPAQAALTPREREVLGLLARGDSNRVIAETLVISEKTVEVHVSNILGKLGATSRTHAAALAREHGLDLAAA